MEHLVRLRAWFEGSLSVRAKLLAALAVALLPALALGGLWAAQINDDRLFTAKERVGVAYLKAVWPIFHAATQDRVVIPKERLHSFVRARIAHDDAIDTAPESAALRAAVNRQGDPEALTGAALTLIAAIGDGSNLILDPELPSYYLMDLAVLSLPELASEADGYAKPHDALRPETWAQLYASAGALNANLDNVRRSKAALAKADPLAAQRLEAPMRRIYASGETLRDAALAIARSQNVDPTSAQLAELRTQERQLQGAIDLGWQAVVAELDAALETRERHLEQSLGFAVLFGLALISLAIFVVRQAGRSLSLPLDRLGAVMNAMASRGDTTITAPFQTYPNEIGAMARSVEVFRHAMQRADALSMALEAERAALEQRVEERTAALAEAVEAAQAASKAKSTFLATMSHEIRTPLNGVLGMADALRSTPLPADAADMVETIQTSGRSLLAILNDVLDISKVEAGKLSLETAPFALDDVVHAVANLYRGGATAKGLTLGVDVAESARGAYAGDAARLRQILQNLVSNAVKFTERGGVSLTVSVEQEDETGALLALAVSDTGPGLSPGAQARLFQPFTQADASITRRYGGTGLGLNLCRQLAELMGGSIGLESREGAGSCFTLHLRLPRAAIAPASPSGAAGVAPLGQAQPAPDALRVLAADDHPINRKVLGLLLGQVGVEPVFVEDGAQAVEAARNAAFDVILLDLHMPVLDGMSAARAIRGGTGPNATTPIIALTADAMAETVAQCQAAGITLYVAKPIDPAALFAAMEQALADAGAATAAA